MLGKVLMLLIGGLMVGLNANAGENIYPDPGFEAGGVAGVARTGARAGYLKGDGKTWVRMGAMGGKVGNLEPFATYQARAYVKAAVRSGSPQALFCYQNHAFGWAFIRSAGDVKNWTEWHAVETTFIAPGDSMVIHPLAGVGDYEAWVDDVIVEKVKSPEETMKAIEAKGKLSEDEVGLLARYYLSKDLPQKARALMELKVAHTAKADVAYALYNYSKRTAPNDMEQRKRCVADILGLMAPGTENVPNWTYRFDALTTGMTPDEKMWVCKRALEEGPLTSGAATFLQPVIEVYLGDIVTRSELAERIKVAEAAVRAGLAKGAEAQGYTPEQRPAVVKACKELKGAARVVEEAQGRLAARHEGRCIVRIGGKKVSAQTHAIVIPTAATPQEEHAAKDLQRHLKVIAGEEIPLMKDADVGERTPIVVGKSALIEKLGVQVDFESLGGEGIIIKTVGPALILAGNKRGTLYACYTFLEDYLNCRWLTPDCAVLPQTGTFSIADIDRRCVPPLEYRDLEFFSAFDADWCVRNKINSRYHTLDEERGGRCGWGGFCHTFHALVPPEQYFKSNPEYYSEIAGKRVGPPEHTQLCLTNTNVAQLVTAAVRRWFKENPEGTYYSVSQMDWGNYCQCPKCGALAEEEGSQAGPLLHFVNAVADGIRKDFPDKIIDTFAYQYSRKPPKHVRPRPNVLVRLCSIECCFVHPLESDGYNKSFREDIESWAKICDRFYVWDYAINFHHLIMPYPNLYVLQPNINFFIRNNVKGIFEQGNQSTRGGEFSELRAWMLAKMLWDPSYDTDRAIDEFVAGYYDAAAGPIRKYINLIHKKARASPDRHMGIHSGMIGSPFSVWYLTPEVIGESGKLFDAAEQAVRNKPEVLQRVQTARLPLIYSRIMLARTVYREEGDRLVLSAQPEFGLLLDRFEKIAEAERATELREFASDSLKEWVEWQRKRSAGLDIVRLRNAYLEVCILPQRDGRIWRIRHLPTGRDILKRFGVEGYWYPTEGGYEESGECRDGWPAWQKYPWPGWNEPYTVSSRTEQTATLEGTLNEGLKIRRSVALDAQQPIIRISSTVSNSAPSLRSVTLFASCAFDTGDNENRSVWTRTQDGSWKKNLVPAKKAEEAVRKTLLHGTDLPQGEWALINDSAGLAVVNRFDPQQVKQCGLRGSDGAQRRIIFDAWVRPQLHCLGWIGNDEGRVNLDLSSAKADLQTGETLSLTHRYEIVRPASLLGTAPAAPSSGSSQ